ncbi:MAG: 16S rRNA (adenine(1518)-N(6)/adenine(1519)-N(6))-dimethyltransferase RsmA [Candidatus Bathyarchaeota archaeon]
MSLLKKTRRLLNAHKISPRKRLGQSFMTDEGLLRLMVSHATVKKNDVVLEIGAGLGFLTKLLSEKCKQVIAVEVDPRLMEALRTELKDLENVNLVKGDVLKVPIPSFDKVVSNPPFYIASPILFWLLEKKFDCAILTFQKEFAERLVAPVGSREYGRLTVTTYYRADIELLDYVPNIMFYPQPDVDSYIVRLEPKPPPFIVQDKQAFFELVQTMFTQRNKKARNAITPFLLKYGAAKGKVTEVADSLPYSSKRVRELAPEDFGALVNEILKKKNILLQ